MYNNKSRRWLPLLVSSILLLLYGLAVHWLVGWRGLLMAWSSIPTTTALLALSLVLLSYLVRAYRFYDYFRAAMHGRFWLCIKMTFYHNVLNNLLPVRSGEVSFPWLMSRYFQVGMVRSSAILIWYRLMDLHTLLCLGLVAYAAHGKTPDTWLYAGLIVLFPAPWLLFVVHTRLVQYLKKYTTRRLARIAVEVLDALPQSTPSLGRAWALTWINWLIKLVALAWILQQFLPMPYPAAWVGVMAGDLTSVLPVNAPAGLGTYEAGVASGLASWGFSFAQTLPAAVNLHLFLLTATVISGGLAWFINKKAPASV
ncbi:MAG: flippase-like domain-containing protein [Gammaproteobacteria bacterium]|nr:flippase-like domain-containing protein [Gammaproteobacteria bacterium]